MGAFTRACLRRGAGHVLAVEPFAANVQCQRHDIGGFEDHVTIRQAAAWDADKTLVLKVWNRLRPQLLDITGGEPFLMPDLVELLTGLDLTIRVAIRSNLSHPLLEFAKHVSPKRVMNVTASFHPMENGPRTHPMNPEVFVG